MISGVENTTSAPSQTPSRRGWATVPVNTARRISGSHRANDAACCWTSGRVGARNSTFPLPDRWSSALRTAAMTVLPSPVGRTTRRSSVRPMRAKSIWNGRARRVRGARRGWATNPSSTPHVPGTAGAVRGLGGAGRSGATGPRPSSNSSSRWNRERSDGTVPRSRPVGLEEPQLRREVPRRPAEPGGPAVRVQPFLRQEGGEPPFEADAGAAAPQLALLGPDGERLRVLLADDGEVLELEPLGGGPVAPVREPRLEVDGPLHLSLGVLDADPPALLHVEGGDPRRAPLQLQDVVEDVGVPLQELLPERHELVRRPDVDRLDPVELVHPLEAVPPPALVPVADGRPVVDAQGERIGGDGPARQPPVDGRALGVTGDRRGGAHELRELLLGDLPGDLHEVREPLPGGGVPGLRLGDVVELARQPLQVSGLLKDLERVVVGLDDLLETERGEDLPDGDPVHRPQEVGGRRSQEPLPLRRAAADPLPPEHLLRRIAPERGLPGDRRSQEGPVLLLPFVRLPLRLLLQELGRPVRPVVPEGLLRQVLELQDADGAVHVELVGDREAQRALRHGVHGEADPVDGGPERADPDLRRPSELLAEPADQREEGLMGTGAGRLQDQPENGAVGNELREAPLAPRADGLSEGLGGE